MNVELFAANFLKNLELFERDLFYSFILHVTEMHQTLCIIDVMFQMSMM